MSGFEGKTHTAQSKNRMSNQKKGGNNPQAKPVIHLDTGKDYACAKDCARDLGLSPQSVRNVCEGRWKQIRGQKFEYVL